MALARMSKAQLALHNSISGELAKKLQDLGCCEFIGESESGLDKGAEVELRSKQCHTDRLLADARYLTRMLEPLESEKTSSFARMLGDIPKISFEELASKVDEKKFSSLVKFVREKEVEITECKAEIARQLGFLAQLDVFLPVKWPLEFFTSGTETISGMLYGVNTASEDGFIDAVSEKLGDFFEYQKMSFAENDSIVLYALLFRKTDAETVQTIATDFSANRIDVPKEFTLLATEERDVLLNKIDVLKEKEQTISNEIAAVADEGLEMARYYGDYWMMVCDRLNAMLRGSFTKDVTIWSFWLPKDSEDEVKAAIEPYSDLTEFAIVKPEEGDIPPTLLENPAWSSCAESLTLMYGTPTYGTIDPSSMMAPFFFLFLGMCFGDAGYGLVLSGIFGYFLIRHELSDGLRKFFILLTIGMLCTVFMGAVTGSWFGDSITAFPFLQTLIPFKESVQFLDPMNDPMTFLKISLGLGFIHVIFGVSIAFAENWRNGDKKTALFDQATWIFFLIALVIFGVSATGSLPENWIVPSKYASILGALLLIATQGRDKKNIFGKLLSGVLSLYNVTGFLGDVLSYSRLLALGLGSAAVGMVINLLCTLVAGSSYIGVVLAVLIFVIGHSFSIIVNLLGAFVHSLRLQYVEFFGKFYAAAGRDFSPLRNTTEYTKLVKNSAE